MPHRPSWSRETLLFARNFLQHPRMLGSLIPSSGFLVERLLSSVDWERARTLVEYGPGVGTFTAQILRRMSPQARLIVFEMNQDFVHYLERTFSDPRLHVVHASAEHVQREVSKLGVDGADYIISCVPFTTMPGGLRDKILRETRKVLNRDGSFLVYQYTRTLLPSLRSHFSLVRQDFEPLNIPPARLFCCTQETAAVAEPSGRL
jgi:phospholipid N-methyltransferase